MKKIELSDFDMILDNCSIKKKLRSKLRFVSSTSFLTNEDWDDCELLAISDRTGTKGVLLLQPDSNFFVIPYEIKQGMVNSSGRAQAIICDLCLTWQSGIRAGSVTFPKPDSRSHTVSYLCCADLKCSAHVRTKTTASHISRSQLREDLTPEQRVYRLKNRLNTLINDFKIDPISF